MKPAKYIFALALISLIGCRQVEVKSQNETVDVDTFISDALSEVIDDSSEESDDADISQKITVSNCIPTSEDSSELQLSFQDQIIFGTTVQVNGEVQRSYNNATCSLSEVGDAFSREHELSFKKVYGLMSVKTSSSVQLNYLGQSIGGGEELERTSSGWLLSIAGNNQELYNSRGAKIIDIALKTNSPLVIKGTLRRENRTIESGSLTVFHNLANYTAQYEFNNVAWAANCKCPVSGVLEVDFAGLRSGSASLEFMGCGRVVMTPNTGEQRELTLRRCF